MERFMNQQNPERQAKLKPGDFAEAESMVHMGFIAQDVEKLVKEKGYNLSVVHAPTNPTDNYSIAYGELLVPLVKAVQEQQKQIEELKKLVEQLMKK
jgi:trimeric autotransporter adhesin